MPEQSVPMESVEFVSFPPAWVSDTLCRHFFCVVGLGVPAWPDALEPPICAGCGGVVFGAVGGCKGLFGLVVSLAWVEL